MKTSKIIKNFANKVCERLFFVSFQPHFSVVPTPNFVSSCDSFTSARCQLQSFFNYVIEAQKHLDQMISWWGSKAPPALCMRGLAPAYSLRWPPPWPPARPVRPPPRCPFLFLRQRQRSHQRQSTPPAKPPCL